MALNNIVSYIRNMIFRVRVTENNDSITGRYPRIQGEFMGTTADMEVLFPYGITGTVPKDSIGTALSVLGNLADRSAICYHPDSRIQGLKEGEIAIGNFLVGTYMKFTEDSRIEVWKEGVIVITDLITHGHVTATDPSGPPGPSTPL